jgi:hypothetical protein
LAAGCDSIERTGKGAQMSRHAVVALYVMAMAVVIVAVDFGLFRDRFWERLLANTGILLVFAAFYLRYLRNGSRT